MFYFFVFAEDAITLTLCEFSRLLTVDQTHDKNVCLVSLGHFEDFKCVTIDK